VTAEEVAIVLIGMFTMLAAGYSWGREDATKAALKEAKGEKSE